VPRHQFRSDRPALRQHTLLWNAHFYLAFAFFALVLLHIAAALFHALVRRDGVFEAMASVSTHDEVMPAE
jgi:cytochrome b561